jgi:hypothetical protein
MSGKLTRTQRLRKAICRKTAFDPAPDSISVDDVTSVWPFLGVSGATPYEIAQVANEEDMDEKLFERLMKHLNSRL